MPLLISSWLINTVAGITLSVMLIVFRRRFNLKRWLYDDKTGELPPSVTIVVAARDEEQSVGRTLREFIALPGVQRIIFVDDGSEDDTLQIARSTVYNDNRVQILEAPQLPSGWIGKSHAIHWASQRVTSDFILFSDADVHLNLLPLKEIITHMKEDKLDHIGGNFRLDLEDISSAITGPVLSALAFVALGLSASRSGAATGAFNLVRTEAYRQNGGHSSIRDQIVDDVALARLLKGRGLQSQFLDLSPAVSVRLFKGFGGFVSAVSRPAISFLGDSPLLVFALSGFSLLLSTAFIIGPIVLLVNFFGGLLDGNAPGIALIVFIVSTYVLSSLPFVLAGWLHSRSICWGFASPIGLIIMTTAVTVAAIRCLLGLEVRWRGRSYPYLRPPRKPQFP